MAWRGGSSTSNTTTLTETTANFSGTPIAVTIDNSGNAKVTSGSLIDTVFNLNVQSLNNSIIDNLEIAYTEDDGLAMFFLNDVSGDFSDAVMIGTPAELAARNAGRSTNTSLNIELEESQGSTVGFTEDAYEFNNFYMTLSGRTGSNWETGCYTPAEMITLLSNTYKVTMENDYSLLRITGPLALTNHRNVRFKSNTMSAANSFASKFNSRLAFILDDDISNLASEYMYLSCYIPESDNRLGVSLKLSSICEVERGASACDSLNNTNTPPPQSVALLLHR